jgi:prefoldin subunit 5
MSETRDTKEIIAEIRADMASEIDVKRKRAIRILVEKIDEHEALREKLADNIEQCEHRIYEVNSEDWTPPTDPMKA